jgi:hypothetical protein
MLRCELSSRIVSVDIENRVVPSSTGRTGTRSVAIIDNIQTTSSLRMELPS